MPGSNPRGRTGPKGPRTRGFHGPPGRTIQLRISGFTRDSAGSALPACDVHLFRTSDDLELDQTTSDATGYYEFRSAIPVEPYYLVAYKVGAPDLGGTTVNTLTGS